MLYNIKMEQVFSYSTTAQIDARLYNDILANEERIEKTCIIIYLILLFIFRGWIGYWLKFGVAIPSKYDNTQINTDLEPIQINYTKDEQKNRTFTYKSLINNKKVNLIPQAHYELSGLTVAYNYTFLFKESFFDSTALYDLGSAWGKLGEKDFYDTYFTSYSAKTEITGSRVLWTEFKTQETPVSAKYAISHWAHSHIIPANRNIMAAMLKIKKWDIVQLEGELVDIEYITPNGKKLVYSTSLSRTDSGKEGDRGNGSCETIYVTSVKIGNYIYK